MDVQFQTTSSTSSAQQVQHEHIVGSTSSIKNIFCVTMLKEVSLCVFVTFSSFLYSTKSTEVLHRLDHNKLLLQVRLKILLYNITRKKKCLTRIYTGAGVGPQFEVNFFCQISQLKKYMRLNYHLLISFCPASTVPLFASPPPHATSLIDPFFCHRFSCALASFGLVLSLRSETACAECRARQILP